jgi:predicted RNA binding protein YcfA (HicA-like mRNA interferase family)
MAGKLPVLKPKEVVRALERAGFSVHHHTGSHARLIHASRPEIRVTVPIHNKDLQPSLLKRILKQAQLADEEFLSLL